MMLSERVAFMMLPLCQKIRLVRFFRSCKGAEVYSLLTRQGDPRLEFASQFGDTKEPGKIICTRLASVLSVFSVIGKSDVCNAVVVANSVFMVKKAAGMLPGDVKPRETVPTMRKPVNANANVTLVVHHSGFVASLCSSAPVDTPSEIARFGIVMQKLFQSSLRKCISGFSHVIAPYQRCFGQRIEGVTSTFFPRNIIQGLV